MLAERTEWVAEEDPHVAIVRIAHDVSNCFEKYSKDDPGVTGQQAWSYEGLLNLLKDSYKLSKDPNLESFASERQLEVVREHAEWIRLCCNGSDPVAAMFWLNMVPRIKSKFKGSEWLLETVSPLTVDVEDELFQFSVESPADAEKVWRNHMPILRWGVSHILKQEMTIEIWDYDINVWTDKGQAA